MLHVQPVWMYGAAFHFVTLGCFTINGGTLMSGSPITKFVSLHGITYFDVSGPGVWDKVFPKLPDGVDFYCDHGKMVFDELNYTICLACLALYVIMAVKPTKAGDTTTYKDSRISAMEAKLNLTMPKLFAEQHQIIL